VVVDRLQQVRICRVVEPDIAARMVATPTLVPRAPPAVEVVAENTLAATTVARVVELDSLLVPRAAPRYLAKEILVAQTFRITRMALVVAVRVAQVALLHQALPAMAAQACYILERTGRPVVVVVIIRTPPKVSVDRVSAVTAVRIQLIQRRALQIRDLVAARVDMALFTPIHLQVVQEL
jgi:hypothetical protein